MAIFCIPQQFIDTLKSSALASDVDLENLYKMDSSERRSFFVKHTDKQTGQFINTKFEQAMVSKQQDAITDWAKSVFTPTERKKPQYKSVLDKIQGLQEVGMLNEKAENAFLEDLVMDKLGINISADEMRNIVDRSKRVEAAEKKLGGNLGNPEFMEENVAYMKAVKEINDYVQSIEPSNVLGILMGTISSGNLLWNLKSAVVNIGSNFLIGSAEAITRRLATRQFRGADNKLARDYIKMATRVYKETGFDLARMMLDKGKGDLGAAGSRILGSSKHSQGPGKIRWWGRLVEDVVFKNLMGFPDAVFAAAHFADSVNLQAMRYAKGDKVKAREYMIDAMRVEPISNEAQALRAQGVLDAQVATWSNDSIPAKATLGIRKLLNDATVVPGVGELRLGDIAMRFVKTPANVIATGMDYAATGALKGIWKLGLMYKNQDFGNEAAVQAMMRDFVRTGLGWTVVFIMAMNTDEDDYRGIFEYSSSQFETARGSVVNAFRIGDKWISTDWLGPLAVAYNAVMYSKKYGAAGMGEQTAQYGVGVLSNLKNLPGIGDVLDYGQSSIQKQDLSLGSMGDALGNWLVSTGTSMLIPSFVGDIAKATDTYERKTSNAWEAALAKVPFVRNSLPEKRTIFADPIPTENPISTILFGARVKTDREDALLRELADVMKENDKSINFTDWTKSSSKKLAQFEKKIGSERYREATIEYGKKLKTELRNTIRSSEYRSAQADKKLLLINAVDTKVQGVIFEKYDFTYKPDKKK